jgi:hypothetical protein
VFKRIEELENSAIELNESREEEIKRREAIEVGCCNQSLPIRSNCQKHS